MATMDPNTIPLDFETCTKMVNHLRRTIQDLEVEIAIPEPQRADRENPYHREILRLEWTVCWMILCYNLWTK